MPKKREVLPIPGTIKTIGNIHRVPQKLWRRWDENGHWMFNNIMAQSTDSRVFSNPNYEKLPADLWKTLRWNFAVTAAEMIREMTWLKP